jgi:thiamine-phosphate pyrophosphorylase
MFIVISNPSTIPDEAALINALFNEGLEVFHLRKPGAEIDELRQLMGEVKPCYYTQIALHQHHQIAKEFSIQRLHFTEARRQEVREETLQALQQAECVLSTSIHQAETYTTLSKRFAYTFFGPVFNSISKVGYRSNFNKEFVFPAKEKQAKVIALGGIDAGNIRSTIQMGFDGAAVLGAVWQSPKESIQQFKIIQQAWKQADR